MFADRCGVRRRRKIAIEKIEEAKRRRSTFKKRRVGLLKKAEELAVLCGCKVAITIESDDGVSQYCSDDVSAIMRAYYHDLGSVGNAPGLHAIVLSNDDAPSSSIGGSHTDTTAEDACRAPSVVGHHPDVGVVNDISYDLLQQTQVMLPSGFADTSQLYPG